MTIVASFLKRFWIDQSGARGTELVILLALVGVALAVAMTRLGDSISQAFDNVWPL